MFAWTSATRRLVVLEVVDRQPSFSRLCVGVAALSAGRQVSLLGRSSGVVLPRPLGSRSPVDQILAGRPQPLALRDRSNRASATVVSRDESCPGARGCGRVKRVAP